MPATPTPRAQKRWTDADDTLLRDKYGLISDATLAKKLGRTINALTLRAGDLGITRSSNFYTASQVATECGVSLATVLTWIKADLIKATRAPFKKGTKGRPWVIKPADLEAFIKAHPERCLPDRMPAGYWRTLLRKQPAPPAPKTIRDWAPWEDAYLINYRGQRTYPELGAHLHRTVPAVHYRLKLLRAEGRLLPYRGAWATRQQTGTAQASQRILWTAEDDAFLRAHYGQPRPADIPGYGDTWTGMDLARHLGRTPSAVRERLHRLGLHKARTNPGWFAAREEREAA